MLYGKNQDVVHFPDQMNENSERNNEANHIYSLFQGNETESDREGKTENSWENLLKRILKEKTKS